jgi:hypothetical protein
VSCYSDTRTPSGTNPAERIAVPTSGGKSLRAVYVLRETGSSWDKSAWAPHGYGGAWRRRQIDDILRRNGVEPVNIEPVPPRARLRKIIDAAQAITRFPGTIAVSRKAVSAAGYSRALYRHNARRPGLARVAILEWGTDPIGITTLKELGLKVIISLMAINSLWRECPNPISGPYPRMYITEVESLRIADAVFCISREELWLLSNLGVPAQYLPYFPDRDRELSLLREREAIGSQGSEFLIVATRGNTDTAESFREQVDWIIRAYPAGSPIFHVVGHQTEDLRDIWSDPRFVFHGTCSDELFTEIRRKCRAICLHQQKGLGAVTRIPDMALAGLRIISNGIAARSFFDMAGVHVYDTPCQFRSLLERKFPMPPPPQRPVELEDAFFDSLLLDGIPVKNNAER